MALAEADAELDRHPYCSSLPWFQATFDLVTWATRQSAQELLGDHHALDLVGPLVDLGVRRVMFATEGRDRETVKSFADDLSAHGGAPSTQLEQVCCDMSPAFIAGIEAYLAEQPEQDDGGEEVPAEGAEAAATDGGSADVAAEGDEDAPTLHRPEIVFDRYHVVAKANEAIDEVRRGEQKTRPELKRSRYVWLKNEENLTVHQREQLVWLTRPSMNLKTARAARWRDDFNGALRGQAWGASPDSCSWTSLPLDP